jgi:hypothetical protein
VDALYPVWEITRFSEPCRYFDRRAIAWGGVVAQAIVAVTPRIWADPGFVSLRVAVFHPLPIRPLDGAIAWAFLRIPQTPARQTSQTETRMAILEINLLAVFPLFDTAARHRL